MMITIHGLPPNSKYQDVKVLIKQECKISDFILDNLVAEPNGCKKVRVGLTDDDEGYRLMKCLDRYRCSGNFVLSVLPVGKPTPQNAPMQNTYDSRGGFQSQPRNDYPPSGNYGNQGPTVPHDMPSRPQQWVGNNQNSQWNSPSMNAQVPQNSFGYQQNSTPVHQNQPFHQQQASQPVRPEMRAGPQGRGPQEQNFGFQPKSNVPDLRAGRQEGRTHALRSVELLDTPSNPSVQVQGRYPPNNQQYQPQDKPMTIMKDNFQGPSSYIAANNQQQGHFQGHGHGSGQGHGSSQGHSQIQPWTQTQGQQMKQPFSKPTMQYEKYPEERKYPPNDNRPDMKSNEAGRIPQDVYKKYDKSGPTFSSQRMEILRRHSPSGRPVLPSDGRVSPSGRGISAPGRRVSPPGRVVSASGRRISPSGRGISPTGRSISASGRGTPPPGRRISPSGRHIPPSVRHISPSGRHNAPPVRHVSPSGRHIPPSVRHVSPSGRRISPSGRRMSPSGRRISPPGRRISPSGRRISPSGRRISPSGRGISPSGRRISPSGRRISPSGRRISPSGRRISPSGRRISPSGRRISPSGRGISPSGRRISPSGRRISPSDRRMAGRISADRRLVSPTRRDPQRPNMPIRYSPSRHQDKATDKYGNDGQKLKHVRPAYEPTAQAPNQTMYSGGYRPNIHENVQYPIPGARQAELSPWQQERDKAMYSSTMKKLEEERREGGRAQGRGAEQAGAGAGVGSPRRSRSPARFKRHSPSPRSPRRSWALEKRRSPDAPPPPVWPGQPRDDDYPPQRHARPEFAPRIDKDDKKHVIPPWERPDFDKDDDHARRPAPDEMRPYGDDRSGPRRSIPDREPAHADRFPPHRAKVPEYTREDFERDHPHRADYRRPDDADRKPYVDKREFRDPPRPADREDRQRPDPAPPRRDSPPRDPSRKGDFRKEIDRDFEDIYKKAQEFKKKTEELRKPGSRRREGYPGEEPEREREPEGEPSAARYHDERHEFRGELARHARRPNDSPDRPRPDDHHAPPSKRKRFLMPPLVKVTRDKAVEELSKKIMDKHLDSNLSPEQKLRIKEELRLALSRILFEMFGEADVSYIEIVIKYQAKYDDRQEHNILRDVMSSMPSQYRNSLKRLAAESCNAIPPKSSRWSPPADWKKDESSHQTLSHSVNWHVNIDPPQLVTLVPMQMPQIAPQVAPMPQVPPMMVPAPAYMSAYEEMPQNMVYAPEPTHMVQHFSNELPVEEGYNLYLCQDDFEPFSSTQAEYLKNFLVSQIIKVTETSHGWAPDFTLKGLQSMYRYELSTRDESSRDWLLNLDFSAFEYFNVLVYNKEELWYERAAIWLPGHSRSRNIEPMEKLKLQNQKLSGVNVGKWKFVKKVINHKGTRLYVDMPPSSARALEKHKMMLSYELQKVSVYLKAIAVDKDSFDNGLKEPSLTNQADIVAAEQNSPIPSINNEPSLIKIALKGTRSMNIAQARKIKEMIVYHLFKYHQKNGDSKTDFVKYGFLAPSYFGVVPENSESKRWIMSQYLGKLNKQPIVVLGGDEENIKYIKMDTIIPFAHSSNGAAVVERIKQSNQGVKGINFNLWKPIKKNNDRNRVRVEIDIDLESVETLSKMGFHLDYLGNGNTSHNIYFKSKYSESEIKEKIQKYKAEITDSYDVANMDIESDADSDLICLD